MKYSILLVSIFLFVGCAIPKKTTDYAPAANPPKGMALIYLYRQNNSIHAVNPDIPIFYLNDDKIGKLRLDGYYYKYVQPGNIEISYKNPLFGIPLWKSPLKLNIEAKAGEVYFVEFREEVITTRLWLVPKEKAEAAIKSTQLLQN